MIRVAILGATGSIGTSALAVAEAQPGRVRVVALAAATNADVMAAAMARHPVVAVSMATEPALQRLRDVAGSLPRVAGIGDEGLVAVATHPDVDLVLCASSGTAALEAVLAAIDAGKTIALANKEVLVMAGGLVMDRARAKGVAILPVDSEHNAIHQCLHGHRGADVRRLILTASGGPFRGRTRASLAGVTPAEALRHPTWQMGPKITIDSATLMNKALEVVEARWLFGLPADRIGVIVHPESVVHSFVEFADGSVLAQLSPPDMRLPIQYALTYPERVPGPAKRLDWQALTALRFEQPDRETFRALDLGYEVATRGGTCGAVLNAANEAAVGRFLAGGLGFLDIARCCRAVLDAHDFDPAPSLARLLSLDAWARTEAARWTRTLTPAPTP